MPRKMIVQMANRVPTILREAPTDCEAQLQELIRDNPDLLPVEEYGLTGPLLEIGRETLLPSGAVDLYQSRVSAPYSAIDEIGVCRSSLYKDESACPSLPVFV